MKLIPPKELKEKLSLDVTTRRFIESAREMARHILSKKEASFAVILGPCSLHNESAALHYAKEVKKLIDTYPHIFFVMRAFIEKARTTTGWKGLLYDPDLNGTNQIEKGLFKTRSLLLEINHMGVPLAAEFVDPLLATYYADLITWGFIGARTSSSQPHRQFTSSHNFPIGIKNAVDGNALLAIQSIYAASHGQSHLYIDEEGSLSFKKTGGNPFSHLVLRGSTHQTNYDKDSVENALQLLNRFELLPSLLVDCSHGNAANVAENQIRTFEDVTHQRACGNLSIRGCMLESFIHSGKQPISSHLKYGVSITDSCLSLEDTKKLMEQFSLSKSGDAIFQ